MPAHPLILFSSFKQVRALPTQFSTIEDKITRLISLIETIFSDPTFREFDTYAPHRFLVMHPDLPSLLSPEVILHLFHDPVGKTRTVKLLNKTDTPIHQVIQFGLLHDEGLKYLANKPSDLTEDGSWNLTKQYEDNTIPIIRIIARLVRAEGIKVNRPDGRVHQLIYLSVIYSFTWLQCEGNPNITQKDKQRLKDIQN